MATKEKRQITEKELNFVEEAFDEFKVHGFTGKKCPWCGGELKFEDRTSAYTINCSNCELKVTVRGL